MHVFRRIKIFAGLSVAAAFFAFAGTGTDTSQEPKISLPYKKMGLSREQAAAHLLSRFSFGATPGQIKQVADMGLEKWLDQQLNTTQPDTAVSRRLQGYDALAMRNEDIVNTYLNAGQVIRIAAKNNLLNRDSVKNLDKPEYRQQLKMIMDQQGYKLPQELQRQLINQKVIRAAYGENQLQEVLTDFWFNHFNVSLTKGQCQQFVMTYERDAIRPNLLGNFEKLLEATAKHPAMLEYLDNATSVSNENELSRKQEKSAFVNALRKRMQDMAEDSTRAGSQVMQQFVKNRKTQGLNENYAREIMELHTLGVDGGYTQTDVTELARALTGWGVAPMYKDGPGTRLMENTPPAALARRGLIREGDFLFRGDKHNENPKTILGRQFPANGGYEEGMKVLDLLANHPSTAKFIGAKLAARFVSDTPSAALVNRMADAYLTSKGNIKTVLITMVNSPEFWEKKSLREKVKSPFELAISAIRATNADIVQPFEIYNWCTKMGQRFYFYQAPTGFPDRASYWINTGSLLNRMNFGLAFATQKIPGVRINLAALNDNHEPESAEAALTTYSRLLLPERDQEDNIRRLTAMVRDVNLEQKINAAADKTPVPGVAAGTMQTDMQNEPAAPVPGRRNARAMQRAALGKKNLPVTTLYVAGNVNTVSQVTGIIIGSPEFQRK
ncbi:DUF1800 domain-containing protein [Sediminibacterium soli]|uniref:DUF1800 domain-containing protein n=1 Tax=Sediminibacterium soli TaxID=2698829 RepID=UPI001379A2F2|nr:DUF1800 domain-containing protein [Sediminibacterium soli]NCI47569.1 DUF1800 domain-containing protein [Sediminibacterium soli]